MMNSVKTEIDDDLDSLMEEYMSRLKRVQQQLLVQLAKVEAVMQAVQGNDNSALTTSTPNSTPTFNAKEIEQLKRGSWADYFLWGLRKIGGTGTLSEVVEVVSQLPLELIQERVENKSLSQVLRLQGERLFDRNQLNKIENTKRKGGVMFQLID